MFRSASAALEVLGAAALVSADFQGWLSEQVEEAGHGASDTMAPLLAIIATTCIPVDGQPTQVGMSASRLLLNATNGHERACASLCDRSTDALAHLAAALCYGLRAQQCDLTASCLLVNLVCLLVNVVLRSGDAARRLAYAVEDAWQGTSDAAKIAPAPPCPSPASPAPVWACETLDVVVEGSRVSGPPPPDRLSPLLRALLATVAFHEEADNARSSIACRPASVDEPSNVVDAPSKPGLCQSGGLLLGCILAQHPDVAAGIEAGPLDLVKRCIQSAWSDELESGARCDVLERLRAWASPSAS